MGTSETALTAHPLMPEGSAGDDFLTEATQQLHERFEIKHVALQVVRVPFTRPCAPLTPQSIASLSSPRDGTPGHARGLAQGHLHRHD